MILLRFSTFVWTVVCGSTSYGFDVCSGCYFAAVLTLVLTVVSAAVWRSLDSGFATVSTFVLVTILLRFWRLF